MFKGDIPVKRESMCPPPSLLRSAEFKMLSRIKRQLLHLVAKLVDIFPIAWLAYSQTVDPQKRNHRDLLLS